MTDDVAHHFGAYVKPIEFVAMLLLEMLREIVGAALVGEAEWAMVELLLQMNGVRVALQMGIFNT